MRENVLLLFKDQDEVRRYVELMDGWHYGYMVGLTNLPKLELDGCVQF